MDKWSLKILTAILAPLVLWGGLEVAVRIQHSYRTGDPRWLLYGTSHRRKVAAPVNYGGYYKYPPGRYRTEEPRITINPKGLRGPDFEAKKPRGRVRLLVMGGSTTFGFSNGDAHTWPYYLGSELKRRHGCGNAEVINFGLPGYDTHNIREAFRREGIGYLPDLLMLYCGLNDVWALDEMKLPQTLALKILTWATEYSLLVLKAREKLRKVQVGDPRLPPFVKTADEARELIRRYEDWEMTRRNLAEIVRTARADNVEVVVVPELFVLLEREGDLEPNFSQRKDVFGPQYYKMLTTLRKTARELDVQIFEFQDEVDKMTLESKRKFSWDYAHLKDSGNHRLARWVAERLLKTGGLATRGRLNCNQVLPEGQR